MMDKFPIRWKNTTGSSIPAYSIIKLSSGTRQTSGELNPTGALPGATGTEALFVTSGLATANNKYGWARSINAGPFWVKYNGSVSDGNEVGPVASQAYVDTTGSGIVVIYKDTAKGLVLCDSIGRGTTTTSIGTCWTIVEYDPITGDVIQTFDRGRGRFAGGSAPFDVTLMLSADENYLYAFGGGPPRPDTTKQWTLVKWDINSGELLWYSDEGSFTPPAATISATSQLVDGCIVEASDGYIWTCSGPGSANNGQVARHDPATGIQSHQFSGADTIGYQIMACPTGGAVVIADPNFVGSKFLRRLDNTATETHSYGTGLLMCEEYGGKIYILTGATIKTLSMTDLSVLDSRAGTGGADTYRVLTTDGTTVWVSTVTGANSKYRAYDATNLSAAELWNAARDTTLATTARLIHKNSALYDFSEHVRNINHSTGAETWESSNSFTTGVPPRRTACAVGSDFTLSIHTRLVCVNNSDGSTRWTDFGTSIQSVVVTSDDRCFACMQRTGPLS